MPWLVQSVLGHVPYSAGRAWLQVQATCTHRDSTNIAVLNPLIADRPDTNKWYECKDCGRLFLHPANPPMPRQTVRQ